MKQNRRHFIFTTSALAFGWLLNKTGFIFASQASVMTGEDDSSAKFSNDFDPDFPDAFPYKLPRLPYEYNALEPFIDKQTMEIHHTKHHQAYINNLNKALENQSFKNAPLVELFKQVSQLDKSVRNNGGGHYNHSLFWQMLKANPDKKTNLPSEKFQNELNKYFGNFENFKSQFSEKAGKHFGSGWCWLIKNKDGLKIVTTPNQDNPLMDVVDVNDRGLPLLGLDVWEHAYYLKYQNKRAEYIENWWNIINWDFVEKRFYYSKK